MLPALTPFAGIQDALDPAGRQAAHIYSLWSFYLWVLVAVYAIVIVWLAIAVVRARRRTLPDTSAEGERPLTMAVSIGGGATIVILLVLLVASVATGRDIGRFASSAPISPIEIQVTGHQWWWEVTYPDPEPDKMFRTANEIHLPVGQPVLLRLATRDVIHSLWIPNLQGKRDLIPGRVNKLMIEADKPGVYRAQCAEFCGLQHAHMALVVVAESNEKYQAWKTHQQTAANDPVTAEQMKGKELFLSLPCSNCHSVTGIEAYGQLGPDLTHIASRRTLAAGELMNSRGALSGWIINAPSIKPGAQMPPNQMTGAELQSLLSYLENLK